MKILKFLVIAIAFVFAFGSFGSINRANAQVVIRARVGGGPYMWHGHHYHHRRPYWRNHHRYYRYY